MAHEGEIGEEDLEQKQYKEAREIEGMGIVPSVFEDIQQEFESYEHDLASNQTLFKFKEEYENLYNILSKNYVKEREVIKRSKEFSMEVHQKSGITRAGLKVLHADAEQISGLKKEIDRMWKLVDATKDKEKMKEQEREEIRDKITKLTRLLELPGGSTLQEAKDLEDLIQNKGLIVKQRDEVVQELSDLRLANNKLMAGLKEKTKECNNLGEDKLKTQNHIEDTKSETLKAEKSKVELTQKMEELKTNKEKDTLERKNKQDTLRVNIRLNLEEKHKLEEQEAVIMDLKEQINKLENMIGAKQKKFEMENQRKNILINQRKGHEEMIKNLNKDVIVKEKEVRRIEHRIKDIANKNIEIRAEEGELKINKESLRDGILGANVQLELARKKVELDKGDIETKMRTRNLLNKKVLKKEEEEKEENEIVIMLDNQLRKLKNEIQAYKSESDKLDKMYHQLDQDKIKYGQEAAQANAKYYHCVEEVKQKNTFISELQKKNAEMEAKLKQQQNLYDAVKSDRNLYSKNLLEAQDQIAELQRKYKRTTHKINQLKEEISSKDTSIVGEDKLKKQINADNEVLKGECEKMDKKINNNENIIKKHEEDISRLKNVINQAEAERQKQKKDYDMVLNERDILGNQLIKRNDELSVLYEKIKIQQSALAKGNIRYMERVNDIKIINNKVANIKRDSIISQQEVACIEDLKKEVHSLDKELLEERLKGTVLNHELSKPMNVHRWRKLEGTDPETYEMIMKIHSLQRRLIAKREEVTEKDVLIQEKEKLYVELKNILAKQSGPEVAEKLQVYQENLKERMKELKGYLSELSSYQSQVNAYKFEIDRINEEINKLKREFFEMKRREIKHLPDEIIPEEREGMEEEDSQRGGRVPDMDPGVVPMDLEEGGSGEQEGEGEGELLSQPLPQE